jgi:hypothetical protein
MSRFRIQLLGLSQATKAGLAVALLVLLLVIGLATEWIMITSVISHSNAQWCDTLSLLTSRPVPKPADPASNPSRAGQYQLYEDFVHIKAKFGCR